mgnify:CR=1 FL=1
MEVKNKHFNQLTTTEFLEIAKLRVAVFVVEQNCPYQEIDEIDQQAWHVWLTDEAGKIAAYGRVYGNEKVSHLGRVLVRQEQRAHHLGERLLQELLQVAMAKFPQRPIEIGAQAHLQKFYGKAGFHTVSEVYLEDDIPHVKMLREAVPL